MTDKQRTTTWRAGVALALTAATSAGCATGRAYVNGRHAADKGDWDAAVAYYREALRRDQSRVDVKVALERAIRIASSAHMARAADLERQDQLPGALAEYKLAADLDTSNALAAAKTVELDRVIRQRVDAARPRPEIERMREEARKVSPLPQLAVDPRTVLPALNFAPGTAVRDVIGSIAAFAGINVTYDTQGAPDQALNRSYSVSLQGSTLQDALNQVLSANGLFYKVVDSKTILVSLDTQTNRQRLEDQIVQVFYLSHAVATDVQTNLTTILNQVQGIAVRPQLQANKDANSIMVRATIPVMQVIERLIRANDKPRAEVVIDVEILEVDRQMAASYGLNLSSYQLGFTFSPELAPPNTSSTGGFPSAPPPFNLNTISNGVSMADSYLTVPTALIKALESDSKTKILARPSLRGTEGKSVTLNLGDDIPVPQTTFSPIAAGGIATTPTTSFQNRSVGVNVSMTPTVTYENEIRIDLSVENSAKGPDVSINGQQLPSFTTRKVQTTLRLQDGESNMLAGLIREEDKKSVQGFPGVNKIPLLRSIFGGTEKSSQTSDIIMIITPRIVRGHELTQEDLQPIYVGTGQNFGLTGPPPLIAPPMTAEEMAALGMTGATSATTGGGQPAQGAPVTNQPTAPAGQPVVTPPASASRNPNIVPLTPVNSAGQPPTPPANPANPQTPPATPANPDAQGAAQPQPQPRPATVTIQPPGQLQAGGGPYTMPIQVQDATQLASVTLTIVYNPAVLRARTVTEGSFMKNGGAATTFTPRIDEAAGRITVTIARAAGAPGVSGAGLLGAVVFDAISAGQANLTVSGSANMPGGQAVPVQTVPLALIVK